MCTAVTYYPGGHYIGRNLDLDTSLGEHIIITPRNRALRFRCVPTMQTHYAIIGMALISNSFPLYYDAMNEKGLFIAGLNFPDNAFYFPTNSRCVNIAPYELIPWLLAQCTSAKEAVDLLENTKIINTPFNDQYPLTPLHWMVADAKEAYTVEPLTTGLVITKNPLGILTNNPPFDYHLYNLVNYLNLTSGKPTNRFTDKIQLKPYSLGMGALGLPGDLSSSSRFIRASFVKLNSRVCFPDRSEEINQFFHILGAVVQQNGCVCTDNGYERTIYSSCCDVDHIIYYYKTYHNSQITGIRLTQENLESSDFIEYPLQDHSAILMENQ